MSQSDFDLANQSRSLFRADNNAALQALAGCSSGATEPTTMYAYQLWADTSSGILKQRNAANNAWINLFTLASGNLAQLGGATFTGAINEARGTVTMHATTMDLWAQPNTIDGSGSAVTITAIANAPQAGARRTLYPITGTVITNGATFAVDGNANYTTKANDRLEFEATSTTTYNVHITTGDGTAVVASASVTAASQAEYNAGTDTAKFLNSAIARANNIVAGTAVSTTSGTSHDWTIPAWAKEISISFKDVSTNGTANIIIQIGDSGGIETSAYLSAVFSTGGTTGNSINGFAITSAGSDTIDANGTILLSLLDASTNSWTCFGSTSRSGSTVLNITSGAKALSASLTTVRITTANGTDAFDAGSINVNWK